jgi:capsular polysaccharide export protein
MPRTTKAALFPELSGRRDVILAEGLLRGPPRGDAPSPWLSTVAPRATMPDLPLACDPERLLMERGWETPGLLGRAAVARTALVAARVGGAWWHNSVDGVLKDGQRYAVVSPAEQGFAGGTAPLDVAASVAMVRSALAEHPAERVVVLAPSGVLVPALRDTLGHAAARGAVITHGPRDPWALLDRASHLYSAGGELGLLALFAGVPVTVFTDTFYAGWGFTEDRPGLESRDFQRSIEEIFAALCLVATRYYDPFHQRPTDFETALAIADEWRRAEDANRDIAACVGMSFWKRRRVADFVRTAAGIPAFSRTIAGALAASDGNAGAAIAGWASRLPEGLAEAATARGVKLIRVEDGFIRSVGLGSDFLPPASLVFDRRGMYYDPRGESDLEHLLRDATFSPALRQRAALLIAQLVARGITKYNLAKAGPGLNIPTGRRRILVPGQVEDDLSIRFGAGTVRSNLDLLVEVRAANPGAFIIYKPHPDVVAGHRVGAVREQDALQFADAIISEGATANLLTLVDEVHTMTSLAGFEALLRGRRVVVFGRPFYAGWGLTVDQPAFDRGRRLSIEELVAGALILYPRYLDPLTRLPCGPEVIIDRLDRPELWRPGPVVLARRLQGMVARRLAEVRAMLPIAGLSPVRGLRERPRP